MSENNTLAQAEITPQTTGAEPQVTARTETGVATLDERAYHELVQGLKETAEPAPTPEAPKEEPTAEQAPAVEEAPAETKAEDETQEAEAELPERVRIGSWSENERKALKIRARNPDLTLEQAMAMVKGEAEPAKAQEEQFVAPADIEAKIDEVAQAKAAAFKNLEFDNE